MAIDVKALEKLEIRDMPFAYSERDTLLYALSVGMGVDPMDEHELSFVYEGQGSASGPHDGRWCSRRTESARGDGGFGGTQGTAPEAHRILSGRRISL